MIDDMFAYMTSLNPGHAACSPQQDDESVILSTVDEVLSTVVGMDTPQVDVHFSMY